MFHIFSLRWELVKYKFYLLYHYWYIWAMVALIIILLAMQGNKRR